MGKPQLGPLPAHMESGELEKGAPSSTDLLESYPNALNSYTKLLTADTEQL